MSRTRTPARTPKAPAARTRSGKSSAGSGARSRAKVVERPTLDQRQFDQIGLGLVALAVFLVFLMYLGSWGGAVGDALVGGLRSLFGQIAYLVPPVVAATGMILILRPLLPAVRPFRTGAILLVLALMLLFAAGSALSALAPTFTMLLAGRVVSSLSHAAFLALALVMATSGVPAHKTGSAIATVASGFTVATFLGVPLGSLLGHAAGWRAPFAVLTAITLAAVAMLALVLPRQQAPATSLRDELRVVSR